MDITERLVVAMMQRDIGVDAGERLLEICSLVCREISCAYCASIMDARKTVLVAVRNTKINEDLGRFVICGACWDKQGESMDRVTSDFISHTTTDFRDYGPDFQLKQEAPPVKTPKAPKVANVRLRSGENCTVAYSRRFTEHGLTFFIHGEQGEWEVSCWDTGMRLNTFKTQKAGIERVQGLSEKELRDIRGAISLHGGLNPSVKGGVS